MKEDINLLILDEPTNHLDIYAREWIEDAVESYDEALLFVSHDRYFINRFATRIWELENGTLRDFRCGYEEYRKIKAEESAAAESVSGAAKKETQGSKPVSMKKTTPKSIERNMQKLEQEISALEERAAALDSDAQENASDYVRLMEIEKEKEEISAQIEEKLSKWEELSEM